ncbi:MAG: hypothetical protein IT335_03055 [Thermomicrobiales bacterium]|jgi:hypothetical protein|nr:hypothetical protein [Thermomicrobiales bacterium]
MDRSLFTGDELARLEQLRFQRLSGVWPTPVRQRFIDRHPLNMEIDRIPHGLTDRSIFRCTMHRELPNGLTVSFSTLFQTPVCEPSEPTLSEVLRWLAVSAAHVWIAEDMQLWASLHVHAANDARRSVPYRGLVRKTGCVSQFVDSLTSEVQQLRDFLGESAFQDLLASADAID